MGGEEGVKCPGSLWSPAVRRAVGGATPYCLWRWVLCEFWEVILFKILLKFLTWHPFVIAWYLFLLWLHPFILSRVISPLISSSILGTYWPREFLFQYPIILPFHTVYGVLKARILKWFAISFSSGPHSVRPLHQTCPSRVSFSELDKAVVLVWLDWLVFCEYHYIPTVFFE